MEVWTFHLTFVEAKQLSQRALFLIVNNTTPFNAAYGRVPHILPSSDNMESEGSSERSMPGLIRDTFRLREISVQNMIEGTAKARLGRALDTISSPSGQREHYQIGE